MGREFCNAEKDQHTSRNMQKVNRNLKLGREEHITFRQSLKKNNTII